jgi:phosphatidate cytidylyltransferase
MSSDLSKRLAVAGIGIPIVLAVAWLGGVVMAAGLGVLAAIGIWECGRMLVTGGSRFLTWPAMLGAAAVPYAAWAWGPDPTLAYLACLLLVFLAIGTLRIPPAENPFRAAALSFAAVAYVGGLLSFALLLRESLAWEARLGFSLFLLPVAITWLSDTAAYFTGRAIGKRPMAPIVSPNKTMEGGAAALVTGPVAAVGASYLVPELAAIGMLPLAVVGLLVAAAAILGDLAESSLKRECGVKDSSNLLPGHGGLLDRMDSLLWAIPVAYLSLGFLL